MAVNKASCRLLAAAAVLLTVVVGCSQKNRAPVVSYVMAYSRLNISHESRRLDVVVDFQNETRAVFRNISLVLTFADHTEVEMSLDELPAYAIRGCDKAVELKFPVKEGNMLGGEYEMLIDDQGVTSLYSTEVAAAVLSYELDGTRREADISYEVSGKMKECFNHLSRNETSMAAERKKRLQKLR